jgi:hypothetical protein
MPYHQPVTFPDDPTDPDDIIVVIGHPFGEVEVSLAVWIATGPAPDRSYGPCAPDRAPPANPYH